MIWGCGNDHFNTTHQHLGIFQNGVWGVVPAVEELHINLVWRGLVDHQGQFSIVSVTAAVWICYDQAWYSYFVEHCFCFSHIVFMSLWCTVGINVTGVACWFHSVNNLSERTVVLTVAAATANDHNNNNNSYTSSNRGIWNHLKIIQIIPEQNAGRTQSQGTTEISHIGYRRDKSE
jgi:hypothetical protein